MPDITISGEIGWEVEANEVKAQFAQVDPEADIEIDLSSPGGSVFQGVQIGHMIRGHKGKTTLTVSAAALSMGAHISANADVVKVHDDTAFMVHNPWMVTAGDHIELAKDAKLLKSMAVMLSSAFAKKSDKPKAEVQKLMNAETWLFGQEIVDAGFADELIETENPESKDDAIAFAKLQFSECMEKLKKFEGSADDYQKIAALLPTTPTDPPKPAKKPDSVTNNTGKPMTEQQFLAFLETNPEAKAFYDGAMAYIKAVSDAVPDISALSLTDVLVLAPTAKTDHETALTDARATVEAGKLTAETVKNVGSIISSADYKASVKNAGIKVLTGEKSFDSFQDLVAVADENKEALKALQIASGQPPNTPGDPGLTPAQAAQAKTKASATALSDAINNTENKVQ